MADQKLQSLATRTTVKPSDLTAVADPTYLSATITGATQANPCVITATAHGFSNGDLVYISAVAGMTNLNGNTYTVAGVTANTFQLFGTDSTGYGAYTSGGTAVRGRLQQTPIGQMQPAANPDLWLLCR